MSMPGFTAEAALNQSVNTHRASQNSTIGRLQIVPAQFFHVYDVLAGITCETYCKVGDIDLMERCYRVDWEVISLRGFGSVPIRFRRLVSTTVVRQGGCLH
jgi:hypothetical protein